MARQVATKGLAKLGAEDTIQYDVYGIVNSRVSYM